MSAAFQTWKLDHTAHRQMRLADALDAVQRETCQLASEMQDQLRDLQCENHGIKQDLYEEAAKRTALQDTLSAQNERFAALEVHSEQLRKVLHDRQVDLGQLEISSAADSQYQQLRILHLEAEAARLADETDRQACELREQKRHFVEVQKLLSAEATKKTELELEAAALRDEIEITSVKLIEISEENAQRGISLSYQADELSQMCLSNGVLMRDLEQAQRQVQKMQIEVEHGVSELQGYKELVQKELDVSSAAALEQERQLREFQEGLRNVQEELEVCKQLYVCSAEDARRKAVQIEVLDNELSASKSESRHLQDSLSLLKSEFEQQTHRTATLLGDKEAKIDELSSTVQVVCSESAVANRRASEELGRLESLLIQKSDEEALKTALLAELQQVVHEKESTLDELTTELSSLRQLHDDSSQQLQAQALHRTREAEKWHIKTESLESMLESSQCESAAWKAQLEHSHNEVSKLRSEHQQVMNAKDSEMGGLRTELSRLERLLGDTSAKLEDSQREISNLQLELCSRQRAADEEVASKDAQICELNGLLDEAGAKRHQLECEVQRLCAKFDTYRAKMEAQLAVIIHEHQLKLDSAETEQRKASAQVRALACGKQGGHGPTAVLSSAHSAHSMCCTVCQLVKVRAELAEATAALASSKDDLERLLLLEVENDRLRSQVSQRSRRKDDTGKPGSLCPDLCVHSHAHRCRRRRR
jgi:chromosome segregation ATPase